MASYTVRPAVVADWTELMDALLTSFSGGWLHHPPFDTLYPDALVPTDECLRDFIVAERNGRLIGGTQFVRQRLRLAAETVLLNGGVGQVFCVPEERRSGVMTAVLDAAIAAMAEAGCHISILGGDRQRYRRFGWENAGRMRHYALTARAIDGGESPKAAAGAAAPVPQRWHHGAATLDRFYAALATRPAGVVRDSRDQLAATLRRGGTALWTLDSDDGFAGVLLAGNTVSEYGGEPAAFAALVANLVGRSGLNASIADTEGNDPLDAVLWRHAATFAVQQAGMVRVFSVAAILKAFQPLLERRLREWNGTATLALRDGDTVRERVEVRRDGGGRLAIRTMPADTTGAAGVKEFTRAEWATVLFGPFLPPAAVRVQDDLFFRLAFPLPLTWPPTAHV